MAIKQLPQDVVNRIAAGEIVVSPRNALKELLENSLDAGATRIDLTIKDGGFKLMQVTDNGSGIDRDDLELLCQRWATSKISGFSDLATIQTLGFRGEALASLSHIAHLSIVTKTKSQTFAVHAEYADGRLVKSKQVAGVDGTRIVVQDLFFNTKSRLAALRASAADEYNRIVDIVARYAVHYNCTFSIKKHGESQAFVVAAGTLTNKIRRVFGNSVANELVELKISSNPVIGLENVYGFVTGLNYTSKKATVFVLFINGRLVGCPPLRRAIQAVYANHLPKDSHAFVYLSLAIQGPNVDVNIHPTKQDVQFLYQDEIISAICLQLEQVLLGVASSRKYKAQSYIEATSLPVFAETPKRNPPGDMPTSSAERRYEYKMVRTDPKQQTLASFTTPTRTPVRQSESILLSELEPESSSLVEQTEESDSSLPEREYKPVQLASIANLKRQVSLQLDDKTTRALANHTLVGIVDHERGLVALQYDVELLLVDFFDIAKNLFYQVILADFGNFGTVHLGQGLSLAALMELDESPQSQNDTLETLQEMAVMLQEYFMIKLKRDGDSLLISQLPLVVPRVLPCIARLPQFARDLCKISWEEEQACLEGLAWALAQVYVPVRPSLEEVVDILGAVKVRLVATRSMAPSVVEIANLHGLYKVFERC